MKLKSCLMVSSFGFLGLINFNNLSAIAQDTQTKANTYPPEYIQEYSKKCLKTSMQEGLLEPEAKQLCDCTIAKFQQKYTLEKFKQLTAASDRDRAAADALIEVGQVCFESILYEN